MGSYWGPLADVLPQEVRDAMLKAELAAIHRGAGRPGEPALMAGVRELLRHVTFRGGQQPEVEGAKVMIEHYKDEARRVAENMRRAQVDEHNALARVWQLVLGAGGRKTLRTEDVRRALEPANETAPESEDSEAGGPEAH